MNPLPHEKIAVSSSETMAVRHAAPDTPAAPPKTPLDLFREGWNCAQAAFDGQFQSLDPQNARPPSSPCPPRKPTPAKSPFPSTNSAA